MEKTEKAAQILNSGGIIVFPTETVFGIGCLLNKERTIEKLYLIKDRDKNKPTLCLVKDINEAKVWVGFNQAAEKLAKAFWPGPLTLCLPIKKTVSGTILGPGNTLGVRVSPHPFLVGLIPKLEAPLLAPSANFSGKKAPRSLNEIDKELVERVNYVVEIEPEAKLPSTIVTFANQKYNVVREGEINSSQIEKVLNK